MRKNGTSVTTGNPAGKLLVATLLAFCIVIAIWDSQPYYHNKLLSLSTTTTPSCSTTTTTANSSPVKPTRDPNKRIFKSYGNAAALFVQMGAYRGGSNTFAIIGLASKPLHVYGSPWYECEWISTKPSSSSSSSSPLRVKAAKYLPDWGLGRVYTVVVINCTFSVNPNGNNSGGHLNIYAYYGDKSSSSPEKYKYEKFVALEEKPMSYNESNYKPPYKYEYLYCGSSLFGDLSASRIREWIAYHAWFFGPRSHFVFHDVGGVGPEVRAVLEPWIRGGYLTVEDVRDEDEFDGYYFNQFLVVNDCLFRYRYAAKWIFYFDVDEYVYLVDRNKTLESVLDEFSDYSQFTIQQNAMSSKLCLDNSTTTHEQDSSMDEWGFEKLVFRDSRTIVDRNRKYAIQARDALSTGVHRSDNVTGKTLHETETKIRYYHYHGSITTPRDPCRVFVPVPAGGQGESVTTSTWHYDKVPFVYDDNMKKLGHIVKQFEEEIIGV